MAITITPAQLALLAPSARSSYRDAFAKGQQWLDQYGISGNNLRIAHFMAQMLHESGGLTIQFENLNYSAGRLPIVWPSRFLPKGPLDPADYAHDPQKLANEVYARASLGNTSPGDGYKYRGRGLLQLTGKASYEEATNEMR
ncbi:MAG: lytic enzyme, partial [Ramlibacter sp.]|nr:lytic enzyme [Ramlibacter sp.]